MKNLILSGLFVLISFFCSFRAESQVVSGEYYRKAAEAEQQGNTEQAYESYSKSALSADRGAAAAYHNMGRNYEKRGDIPNAIKSYEEAVKRNPGQIESIERCVVLHHGKGNWRQTIYYGEMGVKAAPLNTKIPPLLLDAYEKERAGKKFYLPDKERAFERDSEQRFIILFGASGGAGIGYDGSFSILKDPLTFIPFYLQGTYNRSDSTAITLRIENPDNGALMEDTVFLSERTEIIWKGRRHSIGGGILFNHYYNDNFTDNRVLLHDVKLGFLYKYYDRKHDLDIAWYPRMLPSDLGNTKGTSFDSNMLSLDYKYAYNTFYDLLAGLEWREYVFYDHTHALSDFEGICDISGGVLFFDNARSNHSFSVEVTNRNYLRDRDNNRPYDSLNGQGFFGINAGKWFKGDPMSGYYSSSYLLDLQFNQFIHSPFGIYEKIRMEIVMPSRTRNAVSLEIGGHGEF